MNNLTAGQRVTSPEGSGEVLTMLEDKVVVKLDNGQTTTVPSDQLSPAYTGTSFSTDLTQEDPEAVEARKEHASEIVAKLNHLENENINLKNENKTMEISETSLNVINDLIKINNDRAAGFEKAGSDLENDDANLTALFNKLSGESQRYVTELTAIAQRSGGDVAEGTSTSGDLHRAWIDIKAAFTGSDTLAILNECERGEDAAKAAYRDALDPENDLEFELTQILQTQQQGINEGHDLIKALRDQLDATDENDVEEEHDIDETEGENIVSENSAYERVDNDFTTSAPYQGDTLVTNDGSDEVDEEIEGTSEQSKLMVFFVDELKDLLWAEQELLDTLPDMAEAATSAELKEAFLSHHAETEEHINRLEQIFAILGLEPETRKCEAMAGIVDEGDEIISATDEGTAQRDVGLIFAAQKAEHYEIASYGGMIALAKTLGYYDIAETLVLTLDEEKTADAKLTEIAEGQANYDASTESAEN